MFHRLFLYHYKYLFELRLELHSFFWILERILRISLHACTIHIYFQFLFHLPLFLKFVLIEFYSHYILYNYLINFQVFQFFSRETLYNLSFFACAFENLMENFLTSYFLYSHLIWSSKMFYFSRRFKQVDRCSFIFSTNSLFKVKDLLKILKPLSLPISCNLLRVKDMGE